MENSSSSATKICLSCGLCCRGIFFYHDIKPEDFSLPSEPSLALFPSACRLFREHDNCCLIHDNPDRPYLCKQFKCIALSAFLDNKISADIATQKLAAIKTLLNSISRRIHQDENMRIPFSFHLKMRYHVYEAELRAGNQSNLDLYLDIVWLQVLMGRYILPLFN